jgi:hypothetical protein
MNNQLITIHVSMFVSEFLGWNFVLPPIHNHKATSFDWFENVFDEHVLKESFQTVQYRRFAECEKLSLLCLKRQGNGEEECLKQLRAKPVFAKLIDKVQSTALYERSSGLELREALSNVTDGCVIMDAGMAITIATDFFGPYSKYSEHQGYDVQRSPAFGKTVEALQPVRLVATCAETVSGLVHHTLHVRQGDYRTHIIPEMGQYTPEARFQTYFDVMRHTNTTGAIFIATNNASFVSELRGQYPQRAFLSGIDIPCMLNMTPNQASLCEQWIGVNSRYFTGNRFSSFSAEVINRRKLENKTSTTFGSKAS